MIGKILEKLGLRAVPRWQDVLPLQALTEVNFESAGEVSTGFLSPAAWAASPFARLQGNYPAGSLLGIFPAAAPDAIRRTAMTGNVLHIAADGPRIFDALLLKSGGSSYQAFVVSEGSPDPAKVKRLETDGVIRRTNQGSQDLFFGNFDLAEYGPYLEKIAIEAAEGTHFGNLDKKGRRFLYQTIPGVNLPGKRRVTERAELLRGLMNKAGVSVQDKLVLDVGCNLGLLMSQYLKFGAGWCHGWDFPGVVQHTETMLGALGCTRYSTTGTKIESALPMRADLPAFLQAKLDGCVISYVAIRRHIGWLDELAQIPWSFLIYEGHKPDSEADFARHIEELCQHANCRLAAQMWDCEKGSRPRPLAIFVRN